MYHAIFDDGTNYAVFGNADRQTVIDRMVIYLTGG
jgi:hypothetical protein